MKIAEKSLEKAAVKLAQEMVSDSDSYMLIFYGADVSEKEAESVAETVRKKVGDRVDVTLVNGGQSVYYFIYSVE